MSDSVIFATEYLLLHTKIWTEISKIQRDFRISKFFKIEISHHLDKWKMDITRLILKIQDSNFTSKPNFYSRKYIILASSLRKSQKVWGSWAIAKILRGGGLLRPPPPMGDRVRCLMDYSVQLSLGKTELCNKDKKVFPHHIGSLIRLLPDYT